MIENYDTNHSFGKHTICVTFQRWGYRGIANMEVNGNCKGFAALQSAVDEACDAVSDNGLCLRSLTKADAVLRCSAGEDTPAEWKECIVAVEIKSFVKEEKK